MKRVLLLVSLLVLVSQCCVTQSLTVYAIDTSAFPFIKAKFIAFDNNGKQVINISPSDFTVTENSLPRNVLNVTCPLPKPEIPTS